MKFEACTSATVSKSVPMPVKRIPSAELFCEASRSGIFLGNTLEREVPCFMNPDLLMNPHIFVCGMTGAGKTYLMRSLMLKLFAIADYSIMVIDFTGEYSDIVKIVGGTEVTAGDAASIIGRGRTLLHMNLKSVSSEAQKAECARAALEVVAKTMRASGTSRNVRSFVILDEAWKLLSSSTSFETILREGRKYGVGLLLGSQLLEDIDISMLNNVASLFIFRLQDEQAINKLSANYGLGAEDVLRIQNLFLGSCMLIQVHKSTQRAAFIIKRISGIDAKRLSKIKFGESMWIEIEVEKLGAVLRNLCNANAAEIISKVQESGEIELSKLICMLVEAGADRREVLGALRSLRIGDAEIADAFSITIKSLRERHEGN